MLANITLPPEDHFLPAQHVHVDTDITDTIGLDVHTDTFWSNSQIQDVQMVLLIYPFARGHYWTDNTHDENHVKDDPHVQTRGIRYVSVSSSKNEVKGIHNSDL